MFAYFFSIIQLFAFLTYSITSETPLNLDHSLAFIVTPPSSGLGRQRRATPSGDAVLLYSTHDSIFELPFKSASAAINMADFRKIFSSNEYAVEAFSATYRDGDNLLLYGKGELFSRPIRSGPSYLYGQDSSLGKEFSFDKSNGSGLFAADWVDYNVYTVYKGELSMVGLVSHFRKVVHKVSESARNLVVEQTAHFVAWIANEVNLVKMNKDGSSQMTVWTEGHRHILCMTTDPDRRRFFFFVPDIKPLQKEEEAKFALFFSIAYQGEDAPVREGAIKYTNNGSSILAVAKYYERVFVVMVEKRKTGAGDLLYKIVEVKKDSTENMAESIMVSASWPITDIQVSWNYKNQPVDCNKMYNRCPYLCAHLFDDATPMCLCRDDYPGSSSNCQPYIMTITPPPTRAGDRPSQVKNPNGYNSSGDNNLIMYGSIALAVGFFALGGYILYAYLFQGDEDEEGEGEEGEGTDGLEGGTGEGGGAPLQTTGITTDQLATASNTGEEGWSVPKKKKKKKKKRKQEEAEGGGSGELTEGSTTQGGTKKKKKKHSKRAKEEEAAATPTEDSQQQKKKKKKHRDKSKNK